MQKREWPHLLDMRTAINHPQFLIKKDMKKYYSVKVRHYDKAASMQWGRVHILAIRAKTPKQALAKANSIKDSVALSVHS